MPDVLKLQQLQADALRRGIPIIKDDTAAYLVNLIADEKPQKILEIGTAVGYSAAVLLTSAPDSSYLWTIELDRNLAAEAEQNLAKLGLTQKAQVLQGDALEIMPQLIRSGEHFDLIFIDGPKGQYPRLFKLADRLLEVRGILVADNIELHGMLLPETHVPHKHKTMVRRLQEYLDIIQNHPHYKSEIMPIGDGLAVSRKTADNEE